MILSWLLICAPFTSIYLFLIHHFSTLLSWLVFGLLTTLVYWLLLLLHFSFLSSIFQSHFCLIIWLELYFLPESSGWVFIFSLILLLNFNPQTKIQKIDEISVLTINQIINCQDQMLKKLTVKFF